MESQFRGPAGVLAVILLEVALGSLATLVIAPVWGVVKRGYFLLVGWSALVCAVLAALTARGALDRAGSHAGVGFWLLAGLSAVALALLHARREYPARL